MKYLFALLLAIGVVATALGNVGSGLLGNLGGDSNGSANGVIGGSSSSEAPISVSSLTDALSALGGSAPLSTVLSQIGKVGGGSMNGFLSKLPSSALNSLVNPTSILKQLSNVKGDEVPASNVLSDVVGQLPSNVVGDIQNQDSNLLSGLLGQDGSGNLGNVGGLVSSVGSIGSGSGSGSDALSGIINKLVPSGKIPASTIKNVISTSNPTWSTLFNAVAPSDVLKSLPSSVLSAFNQPIDTSILNKLKSVTGTLSTDRLTSLLSSSGIGSALGTLGSTTSNALNGVNQVGQVGQNIGNTAGKVAGQVLNTVGNGLSGLSGLTGLTGQIGNIVGQISSSASGVLNDLLSSVKTVDASVIKNALSSASGSTVGSVISPLCQVIGKSSSNLPSSILNQAISSSALQQLNSLTGNVPISKVLGIVLPSSIIQQITSNGAGQIGENVINQASNAVGGASQIGNSAAGQASGQVSNTVGSGLSGLSSESGQVSGSIGSGSNGASEQASSDIEGSGQIISGLPQSAGQSGSYSYSTGLPSSDNAGTKSDASASTSVGSSPLSNILSF